MLRKKILTSFSTKIVSAILSVGIVLLITNFLGADGRGQTSTINTTIVFIIMFNSMIGSDALVYFIPKTNIYKLLLPSYLYAIFSGAIFLLLFIIFKNDLFNNPLFDLQQSHALDPQYLYHIVALATIGAFFEMNIFVFIGRNDVNIHNYLSLLKVVFMFIPLSLFFFLGYANTDSFIISLYISYVSLFILSLLMFLRYDDLFEFSNWKVVFKGLLKLGPQDQVSNILHMVNYRIGIYFLLYSWSWEAVGIFSVALFLMESVLILSRSAGVVHFSKIVNTNDTAYNDKLTLNLFKITFFLLLFASLSLAMLPSVFYTKVFGNDFTKLNYYILLLTPGIVAYGSTNVFNNYFCSSGKFYENILSNALALVASLFGCFYLIPQLGIAGACITFSSAFIIIGVYLVFKFLKTNNLPISSIFSTFRWKDV